jgi:DNA mismatch repair protein MutS
MILFWKASEELTKIDINTLTPIEALMKLNAIKKMIGG